MIWLRRLWKWIVDPEPAVYAPLSEQEIRMDNGDGTYG